MGISKQLDNATIVTAIVATQQQCQPFVRLLQAAPSSKRSWPAGTDLCGTYNGYCNGVIVVLLLPMLCWSMVMPMMMTIAASVAFNCSRNVRYGINIVIATNWQLVLPFVSFLFLLLCVTFAYFSPPLMLAVVRVNGSLRTSVFLFFFWFNAGSYFSFWRAITSI